MDREPALAFRVVQYDQGHRSVRVLKRHRCQTLDAGCRLDAMRARHDEAARVPEDVILEVARDSAAPGIDRHDTPAVSAAARVWAVRFVEREIPQHDAARPATRRADDEFAREPTQRIGPAVIPFPSRAFG